MFHRLQYRRQNHGTKRRDVDVGSHDRWRQPLLIRDHAGHRNCLLGGHIIGDCFTLCDSNSIRNAISDGIGVRWCWCWCWCWCDDLARGRC